METFQVPQYIEEESRLVGSFTFSQVIILVLGGGLVYLAYTLLATWLSLLAVILIGSLTIILAFVQVDGMPTYKLIMPLIRHFWLPKVYIWRKPVAGATMSTRNEEVRTEKTQTPITKQPKKKVNIEELSNMLNKGEKKL